MRGMEAPLSPSWLVGLSEWQAPEGKGPKLPLELRTPRRARNYAPELRAPVPSVTFERNVAGTTTWRP